MMTHPEIELKVREIISEKFDIPLDRIHSDTRLVEDLRVDSFGAVEFMFELEEAFGLNLPDSDVERVRSVKDVVGYLSEWLGKKASEGGAGASVD
jgi:acyl carrier protein